MTGSSPDISIVVPVYGSDSTLEPLYQRVAATMSKIPATFELIFVDDCGPGQPWEIISRLAQDDSRVIGLKLSRNFGQHCAIMAGVEIARGNWLVIMDCDLQDPPEEIQRLRAKALEGNDAVLGCRIDRQDGLIKRLKSQIYHSFFDYMTEQKSDKSQANFGIYSRKVVDVVKQLTEQPRTFLLLVKWAGFNVVPLPIQHCKRPEGKSSYTLRKQIRLAADTIISYSNKPLRLCIDFGFLMAFGSFLFGIWLVFRHFILDLVVEGWTSVMVSMYFLSGVLLVAIGIQGIYLGRIFNLVKNRPLYIVKERTPNI